MIWVFQGSNERHLPHLIAARYPRRSPFLILRIPLVFPSVVVELAFGPNLAAALPAFRAKCCDDVDSGAGYFQPATELKTLKKTTGPVHGILITFTLHKRIWRHKHGMMKRTTTQHDSTGHAKLYEMTHYSITHTHTHSRTHTHERSYGRTLTHTNWINMQ